PEDLKSLDDLKKIPFTSKEDLRDTYPYGLLSADKKEVVRMHASSGTTGKPTVIFYDRDDLNRWTHLTLRSLRACGCGQVDVFQNMMTYGLFTGGLGLHYGAEDLGMFVIPSSGGNTRRQLMLMKDFGTTVVHTTPSYMLHLFAQMDNMGVKLSDLKLKKAIIGAEPHSEDLRRKIETSFGIDAYNSYGLSEMNGPSVAFECVEKSGMHLWEDAYRIEIVDRNSLKPVEDGVVGELVLTNLIRHASPILRYRTKDLTRILPGTCACGRTSRRVDRMMGRTDDMLIINGVNVFPSQIEEVVMKVPEAGNNYRIVVRKKDTLDVLIVELEVGPEILSDDTRDLYALKGRLVEALKASISIKPIVEFHEPGQLPVQEGKAIRVVDERGKLY
ncbi:MAG: phenylacetate--CoA ligase, partial [Spirochaetaceae bacterium]|nr:phenylacetate--CoA ligase [Spirochaetaceae bacterium]